PILLLLLILLVLFKLEQEQDQEQQQEVCRQGCFSRRKAGYDREEGARDRRARQEEGETDVFRKVIVSRGVRWDHSGAGVRRRGLLHHLAFESSVLTPPSPAERERGAPKAGRIGAMLAGLIAVLVLVTGE